MRVHEWGRRDDVPLVFWHTDASRAELRTIAPVLASAGFHVLALPADQDAVPALVDQLNELLDKRELDRPVLVGRSRCGAVALGYAAAHPEDVRALVLLDDPHLEDTAWPTVAVHKIPTFLLFAAEPPPPASAVPHGEVKRVARAGLGDEIAGWLVEQGL
jgi:pimeloyl-ACP methyl ester carboxylesterase